METGAARHAFLYLDVLWDGQAKNVLEFTKKF